MIDIFFWFIFFPLFSTIYVVDLWIQTLPLVVVVSCLVLLLAWRKGLEYPLRYALVGGLYSAFFLIPGIYLVIRIVFNRPVPKILIYPWYFVLYLCWVTGPIMLLLSTAQIGGLVYIFAVLTMVVFLLGSLANIVRVRHSQADQASTVLPNPHYVLPFVFYLASLISVAILFNVPLFDLLGDILWGLR